NASTRYQKAPGCQACLCWELEQRRLDSNQSSSFCCWIGQVNAQRSSHTETQLAGTNALYRPASSRLGSRSSPELAEYAAAESLRHEVPMLEDALLGDRP